MSRFLLFLILNMTSVIVLAQKADLKMLLSKYGLPVVKGTRIYEEIVLANPENQLVDLRQIILDAIFDVRYATANNL